MSRDYKGYALFTDVESRNMRISNQAIVLANIFEDHLEGAVVSMKGAGTIIGYCAKVDDEDKTAVTQRYKEIMQERGFLAMEA